MDERITYVALDDHKRRHWDESTMTPSPIWVMNIPPLEPMSSLYGRHQCFVVGISTPKPAR